MKILHVSNKPVYPLVDGGCVAMSKILQSLQQLSPTVDHVFVQTPKHPFVAGAYPADVVLPLSPEQTQIDTSVKPFPALKALLTGENYNLQRFYDGAFEQQLVQLVAEKQYDVIVLESLFLAAYIPALRSVAKAKVVVRTHNVEHELWEQQAAAERTFGKKGYLRSLARTLKREEIQLLSTADLLWAITPEDAQRFAELGIQTPVTTIPVAMEVPELTANYSISDFFHLGSLNWEPNRKAVQRLAQLWQAVSLRLPVRLHIAGSFSEGFQLPQQEQIVFHGFVEDGNAFMASHGVLAAPVISGSGVRIKLLEAMSLGVCCVTTPLGATGIDPAAEAVLLAERDHAWISTIERIAHSEELRRTIGTRARDYIRKYHSFAAVNSQIRASLER